MAAFAVSICKVSVGRLFKYPSSIQSAGVGGMLPNPVPSTGGPLLVVLLELGVVLIEDDSDEPLTLTDLAAGGGPGGGGGSGIPGSQLLFDGDRFRD